MEIKIALWHGKSSPNSASKTKIVSWIIRKNRITFTKNKDRKIANLLHFGSKISRLLANLEFSVIISE